MAVLEGCENKWNFPLCFTVPADSASDYYNRKKFPYIIYH